MHTVKTKMYGIYAEFLLARINATDALMRFDREEYNRAITNAKEISVSLMEEMRESTVKTMRTVTLDGKMVAVEGESEVFRVTCANIQSKILTYIAIEAHYNKHKFWRSQEKGCARTAEEIYWELDETFKTKDWYAYTENFFAKKPLPPPLPPLPTLSPPLLPPPEVSPSLPQSRKKLKRRRTSL